MIEYNEIMLTAILGLSATVWGLMEFPVKPLFGRVFDWLTASKYKVVIDPQAKGVIWRVLGVVLGISAVVLVGTEDVSFLRMWNIQLVDAPEWADVLITGVFVGLGDRAIHWLVDWLQANGEAIGSWLKVLSGANS